MTRRSFAAWLGALVAGLSGAARLSRNGDAEASSTPQQADTERMRAALPYPRVTVRGEQALTTWTRLRAEGRGWPVIVGDDEQLDAIAEQFSIDDPTMLGKPEAGPAPPTPAAILAEAATLSYPLSLAAWIAAEPERIAPPVGSWPAPGAVQGTGLTVASDIVSGRPFATVHILLLPTTRSWEVPAYLRWGNWNECPSPAEHVAALRRWHEAFGTELVGINRDTINLRAAQRPDTRQVALALAQEHYAYCPDIVDQGVETLSALAATLMTDHWWFFWWD